MLNKCGEQDHTPIPPSPASLWAFPSPQCPIPKMLVPYIIKGKRKYFETCKAQGIIIVVAVKFIYLF